MTRYVAITTCNADGWRQTGREMVRTFLQHWPLEVQMLLYAEDFVPEDDLLAARRLTVRRLPGWVDVFKKRNRFKHHLMSPKSYNYRFDAPRFSHKVGAITDAARMHDSSGLDSDVVLIWLDADTVTHAPVTLGFLDSLFPSGAVAWLDRERLYPECGFLMFRAGHPAFARLLWRFQAMYERDELFQLPEWHDSFVLQHLVEEAVNERLMEPPVSLSGEARVYNHVFIHSVLGSVMDHKKGDRKTRKRSHDLKVPRTEDYWQ